MIVYVTTEHVIKVIWNMFGFPKHAIMALAIIII